MHIIHVFYFIWNKKESIKTVWWQPKNKNYKFHDCDTAIEQRVYHDPSQLKKKL